MKKVTITHEAEITFSLVGFEEDEIKHIMNNQDEYMKAMEIAMKDSFECGDLHIKDLKLFIHDGEV